VGGADFYPFARGNFYLLFSVLHVKKGNQVNQVTVDISCHPSIDTEPVLSLRRIKRRTRSQSCVCVQPPLGPLFPFVFCGVIISSNSFRYTLISSSSSRDGRRPPWRTHVPKRSKGKTSSSKTLQMSVRILWKGFLAFRA
jgi:hypothetical protein